MDIECSTFVDTKGNWYGTWSWSTNQCQAGLKRTYGMCRQHAFRLETDIWDNFRFDSQYLIVNFGMSENFGPVDLEHLLFPAHMKVDYIRVYQPSNAINIGCDPKAYPTKEYIEQYVYFPPALFRTSKAVFAGISKPIPIRISPHGLKIIIKNGPRTH